MRRLRRAAAIFLGVIVGLALIEVAFHVGDDGAFPARCLPNETVNAGTGRCFVQVAK